jgi:hypothetical protein
MPLYDLLNSGQIETLLPGGFRWGVKPGDEIGPTLSLFDNNLGGAMLMGPPEQVATDYAKIRLQEKSALVVERPKSRVEKMWACVKLLLSPKR